MDDQYNKLLEIVSRVLTIRIDDPELDLMDSGYLDSLTLVQLMMEIEESFGFSIPPERVDIDDYRTLKTMNHMVHQCLSGAAMEPHE